MEDPAPATFWIGVEDCRDVCDYWEDEWNFFDEDMLLPWPVWKSLGFYTF